MRLWSVHPKYLDPQGLVAVWREGLLAQAVLLGHTRGYRQHPQLLRFRAMPTPIQALGTYLQGIVNEATTRGYNFDLGKIYATNDEIRMTVTRGQLEYEFAHLRAKLQKRSPQWLENIGQMNAPHPMFRIVEGVIEDWERV